MVVRRYYRTDTPPLKRIKKKSRKKQKKEGGRKAPLWIKTIGVIFGFAVLSVIGVFAYYASKLPNPEEFKEMIVEESTKIYDRKGNILLFEAGKNIKRTVVSLDQISTNLQQATIAAEDDEFYNHPGIDIKGLARALIFRGEKGGGSTITQQLVKNTMFLEKDDEGNIVGPAPRTLPRKIQEAIMALEIERRYSKDEILELYLNQIPYGSIFYGVESASRNYFKKPAKDLSLAEAATLAALPQSPSTYLKNPNKRKERKNWILDRMVSLEYMKREDAEKSKDEKIILKVPRSKIKNPYFTREVEKKLIEFYGEEYQRMGLKVYTTLDYKLQSFAEKTVSEWSEKLESWYGAKNAALTSIDPKNGQILVMVGGRNFKESEVNIWTPEVKGSLQSPGSVFKPIVFASAFKRGYTPDTILWDVKTVFDKNKPEWPDNYDFKQRGPVKMKESLGQSLNIPAVKSLYLAGIDNTIETAKAMGMAESFNKKLDPTEPGLSLAIGGKDMVPLELVSAFGVFSTEGLRSSPTYILKIENKKGEIIYEPEKQPVKVLDQEICRQINSILSDNNLRAPTFGSSSYLYINSQTAVKTGTSTNNDGKIIDVWTIGYTEDLVTGVWVGNNRNEPMYGGVFGSSTAAPIWRQFMIEATKNHPTKDFAPPKEIKTGKAILDGYLPKTTVKIDTVSGKLATELTPGSTTEKREFLEAHSILWWVEKEDPQGEYPKNPFSDLSTKAWEDGVKAWAGKNTKKENEKNFLAPIGEDNVHTTKNQPKIGIRSQEKTNKGVSFVIQIRAPKGIKKTEIFLLNSGKKIETSNQESAQQYFNFGIDEVGNRDKYRIKVRVTDEVKNVGETTFTIS